jgi:hypothetical protein
MHHSLEANVQRSTFNVQQGKRSEHSPQGVAVCVFVHGNNSVITQIQTAMATLTGAAESFVES